MSLEQDLLTFYEQLLDTQVEGGDIDVSEARARYLEMHLGLIGVEGGLDAGD